MRWKIKENDNIELTTQLQSELGVPETVAKLLVDRNVKNFDEAKKFFRPSLSDLHDPFLMEDMQLAVQRVNEAIDNNQKILIYGDYDVDGTTSVALMYSFLKNFTDSIYYYQPDRYLEGYGISFKAMDFAKENNIELIIALDCGIKAVDKIEKGNEYGIDTIICDHHRPGEIIPNAYAILNPKKSTCNYPYTELCGCGIGFKLTQAIANVRDEDESLFLNQLDLVAIAIAADIVPITGENRILATHGLKLINSTPRIGISVLLEQANKNNTLTITDLVFVIAPRINAAGRMDSATKAVELLLSENSESSEEWAHVINKYNDERRELDSEITIEALNLIAESQEAKSSTVVFNENWHKGVVGIVASRLIETHYKPTIVLCGNDGIATGSARSVKGFDVHNAIEQCAEYLEKFGGHKYAAGLSLKTENIPAFIEKFENVVSATIEKESLTREILIESEINASDLLPEKQGEVFPKIYRLIEQFAPFGPGNMKPVFLMKGLIDKNGWSRIVGESHLKLSMSQNQSSTIINGIGFGLAEKINLVENKNEFQCAFTLDKNFYNNRYSLQLMVKDIKAS